MDELGDLKNLMTSMREDFNKRFSSLEEKITANNSQDINSIKTSVDKFQNDFKELNKTSETRIQNDIFEEVFQEFSESQKRKCNLLLFDVPEHQSNNKDDRVVTIDNIDCLKLLRLGRFLPDKCRSIKVILNSEDQVHQVFGRSEKSRTVPPA